MNSLERYIEDQGLDECDTMNALQDMGIISDNCVDAADVDESDCRRAIEHLEDN